MNKQHLMEFKMFISTFIIKLNGFDFKFMGLSTEKGFGSFAFLLTLCLNTFVLHVASHFVFHIYYFPSLYKSLVFLD